MSKPLAIQLLTRKVDTNGNVPRLLAVYSPLGVAVAVETIDYGNIPLYYRDVVRLPDMELTPSEFRSWRQLQKFLEKG